MQLQKKLFSRSGLLKLTFGKSFCSSRRASIQYSTNCPPRLRFAPSPTGLLHLGGLRTALYNYLMCRKTGGSFILRIEDTDRSRLLPGAVENIQDSLEWMGLKPDEGPRYGGPFGPYVQSERLELYRETAEKLIEVGAAYRCYCTPLRLEVMRKSAVKDGVAPGYDNRCRVEPAGDVKNQPFTIRLKLDVPEYEFHDQVYGPVVLRSDLEGDPVIMKSDGYPTYHLANVVDDHHMGITHVLRGIEWQTSTSKHLRIYDALKWQPPVFAHLPLLVNSDGSKLSKRKGAKNVMEYRDQGIYPEALINLLAQASSGFTTAVAQTSRLFPLDELINQFDLSFVNRHPCQLNFSKLADFNKQALANHLRIPAELEKFVTDVHVLVKKQYGIDVSEPFVKHVVALTMPRLTNVQDLFAPDMEFLWCRRSTSELIADESRLSLNAVLDGLKAVSPESFKVAELSKRFRSFSDEFGCDFKHLMADLRLALSGQKKGPSVAEMCELLGKDECISRLETVNSDASRSALSGRIKK